MEVHQGIKSVPCLQVSTNKTEFCVSIVSPTVSENKLLSVVMKTPLESVPLSKDAFVPKTGQPASLSYSLHSATVLACTLHSSQRLFFSGVFTHLHSVVKSSFQPYTASKTNLEEFFFPCILMLATEQNDREWNIPLPPNWNSSLI